jgi:hypothetical protein
MLYCIAFLHDLSRGFLILFQDFFRLFSAGYRPSDQYRRNQAGREEAVKSGAGALGESPGLSSLAKLGVISPPLYR